MLSGFGSAGRHRQPRSRIRRCTPTLLQQRMRRSASSPRGIAHANSVPAFGRPGTIAGFFGALGGCRTTHTNQSVTPKVRGKRRFEAHGYFEWSPHQTLHYPSRPKHSMCTSTEHNVRRWGQRAAAWVRPAHQHPRSSVAATRSEPNHRRFACRCGLRFDEPSRSTIGG